MTGGLNFPYVDQPWNLISIYGDDGKYLVPSVKKTLREMRCRHFLSLNFWDITDSQYNRVKKKHSGAILFNKDQAQQVVDFIDVIQSEEEESALVAHCSAGISRSGAVGVFACDYCKLDYNKFMKDNPYLMANQHVLRLLRETAGMTPSFVAHDGIDKEEYELGTIIMPNGIKKGNRKE